MFCLVVIAPTEIEMNIMDTEKVTVMLTMAVIRQIRRPFRRVMRLR